jgi:hypothetical protein
MSAAKLAEEKPNAAKDNPRTNDLRTTPPISKLQRALKVHRHNASLKRILVVPRIQSEIRAYPIEF